MDLLQELDTLPKRNIKFNNMESYFRFNKGMLDGITDAVGLTNYGDQRDAENRAASAAAKSSDQAYAINKENLAFQKEQYNDWAAIYKPMQEQLADYYSSDDSTNYQVAQSLQSEAAGSQAAVTALQAELAQRGIAGSGIEAAALSNISASSAQNRSNIRASADDIKAQNQMNFLGLGLGQGTSMLGINATSANAAANTLQSSANSLNSVQTSYANMQNQARMNMNDNMAKLGSSAITKYSDKRLKKNIKLIGTISGINFYVWEWNKKANKIGLFGIDYGVIAQEVKKKYRVSFKGTKYIGVNYSKLLGDI